MPISMAALKQARVRLTIDTGQGDINFAYYPHRLNDDWARRIAAFADKPDTKKTAGLLADVLADWDITSDGTTPLPINEMTLLDLGPGIRTQFLVAIQEDAFPNLKNGTAA